jgi:hypothetical protein
MLVRFIIAHFLWVAAISARISFSLNSYWFRFASASDLSESGVFLDKSPFPCYACIRMTFAELFCIRRLNFGALHVFPPRQIASFNNVLPASIEFREEHSFKDRKFLSPLKFEPLPSVS